MGIKKGELEAIEDLRVHS